MIHSFLLIGQSNMAGRGFLSEAEEIKSDRIKVLRNGRWQNMFRPVTPDRITAGVCLAESFAEKYAEKYGVDVGLIPCADGGTSLDQWKSGGLLYDNAVNNARLAMRTSTIAGVLWHQGEADCPITLARQYKPKFEAIMESLRSDLDLYDVPFILGGLGDFLAHCEPQEHFKSYNLVNKALEQIAEDNEMTGFVSAKGLSSNPDNLHFNAKSLYEFGHRYFEVYEKIRNPKKVFLEKLTDDISFRTEMEKL